MPLVGTMACRSRPAVGPTSFTASRTNSAGEDGSVEGMAGLVRTRGEDCALRFAPGGWGPSSDPGLAPARGPGSEDGPQPPRGPPKGADPWSDPDEGSKT